MAPFPRSKPGAPASSAQVRPLFPVKHSHRHGVHGASPQLARGSSPLCPHRERFPAGAYRGRSGPARSQPGARASSAKVLATFPGNHLANGPGSPEQARSCTPVSATGWGVSRPQRACSEQDQGSCQLCPALPAGAYGAARSQPRAPSSSAQVRPLFPRETQPPARVPGASPLLARGLLPTLPRCDHSFLGNTATGPGSPELARRSSKLCPPVSAPGWGVSGPQRACSEPTQGSCQLCPGAVTLPWGNTATGPGPRSEHGAPATSLPRCEQPSLGNTATGRGSPEVARRSGQLCPGAASANAPGSTELARCSSKLCPPVSAPLLGRIGPTAGLLGAGPGLVLALPRCDHSSLRKHSHRPGVPGASSQLMPALPRCDHSQRPGVHGASPPLARGSSKLCPPVSAPGWGVAGRLGASPELLPPLPRCDHSSLGKHSHRPGSPELARCSCQLCPALLAVAYPARSGGARSQHGAPATSAQVRATFPGKHSHRPGVPGARPQLLPALPRCDHSQRPGVHGASSQLARGSSKLCPPVSAPGWGVSGPQRACSEPAQGSFQRCPGATTLPSGNTATGRGSPELARC
ncbi:unnamed protein product [Tetraodon nigroviridis]|uniref:(spotted green pufferfish) hypothetical protein n=1 Tax=Tetraodon nigroviridis TaxID=99883 RepID=Q4RLQ1_TETNG|nr:unnamed protein product [Tetraodon nigroviridis]